MHVGTIKGVKDLGGEELEETLRGRGAGVHNESLRERRGRGRGRERADGVGFHAEIVCPVERPDHLVVVHVHRRGGARTIPDVAGSR